MDVVGVVLQIVTAVALFCTGIFGGMTIGDRFQTEWLLNVAGVSSLATVLGILLIAFVA